MLNYAETTNNNTIVPEDQLQVLPLPGLSSESHLLSGLLSCPDFRKGFEVGQKFFEEDARSGDVPKSEDDLVFFVNHELSTAVYRREKRIEQHYGFPSLS